MNHDMHSFLPPLTPIGCVQFFWVILFFGEIGLANILLGVGVGVVNPKNRKNIGPGVGQVTPGGGRPLPNPRGERKL